MVKVYVIFTVYKGLIENEPMVVAPKEAAEQRLMELVEEKYDIKPANFSEALEICRDGQAGASLEIHYFGPIDIDGWPGLS